MCLRAAQQLQVSQPTVEMGRGSNTHCGRLPQMCSVCKHCLVLLVLYLASTSFIWSHLIIVLQDTIGSGCLCPLSTQVTAV